jgi:hypothetical protein
MAGLVYGGKFEQTVNEHFSQKNIAQTIKKFKEMEQKHGSYSFGQMMKQMMPSRRITRTGTRMQARSPTTCAST